LYTLYDYLNGTAELPANPIVLTFDDGYTDLYQNAFPTLQAHDFTGTFFMITDFVEDEREGYMTWEMVEEMAAAGMRFETHSRSHPDLRGQTSDFLIWQVLDSQEALTQHIGYTPRFIAYPFGQYDENLAQFLEAYDFWGGLTAESGLEIGLENRFTWPRLYIPADTPMDLFAAVLAEGQTTTYQPEIVEGTEPAAPLTMTVSLSTTQGVITTPAVLVFDESLNADWTVRTSPDVHFDFQDEQEAHSGSVALAYSPNEDFGSFFLQVRPNAATPYLRDDIIGVAFWLYTGSEPLALDDLALVVTGSNEFPYWSAVDESIDLDEFDPTFEDTRFELGFNRPISASNWIQVILFLDDLAYDTDYMYITGLNLVNNAGVSRTFLIDELLFILRGS
jgi:peptidoglycan/xylan/chitin deacetylase (PgdA/CDA1 family)